MRDIQHLLKCWGGWASSESNIDYSHIAAGFKGLLPRNATPIFSCTDNDGLIIDNCIAKLRKYNVEEYNLIVAHYRYNISLRTIAKKKKCSDGTIRKSFRSAEGFISGVLYMLDVKLEMD